MRILATRAAAARRTNFLLHRRGLAAVFLVWGLLCGNASAQEEPSFRTGVNLVLLDVSVTDSKGVPVADLNRENFEVKEDGQVRDLSGFDLGSAHASIALVVDFSASMKPRYDAVVASARHFVSLLRPQDEAALFAFNEDPVLLADRMTVASMDRQSWLAALATRRPTGQTALYDAVIRASRELNDAAHERRVMVILSDGEDTASSADLKDAIETLQSSNRLLYAIGIFEPGEPDTDAGALRKLAESTGGLALFDDDAANLPDHLARIMSDLRQRYLLSFHSEAPADGETIVRKLSVTARDAESQKLKVKGRNRYRAVGRTAATGQ